MLPGDVVQKDFIIENDSSFVWGYAEVELDGSFGTDLGQYVLLNIDECSVPYVANVCSGTEVHAINPITPQQTALVTPDATTLGGQLLSLISAPGSDGYFRLTVDLPLATPNIVQGQTESVSITFSVAQ